MHLLPPFFFLPKKNTNWYVMGLIDNKLWYVMNLIDKKLIWMLSWYQNYKKLAIITIIHPSIHLSDECCFIVTQNSCKEFYNFIWLPLPLLSLHMGLIYSIFGYTIYFTKPFLSTPNGQGDRSIITPNSIFVLICAHEENLFHKWWICIFG